MRDEFRGAHYKPEFDLKQPSKFDPNEYIDYLEKKNDGEVPENAFPKGHLDYMKRFEANNKNWLKSTIAEYKNDKPEISYEPVDTSIVTPRPRKYDIKLNKKVRQLARKSALAYKAKDGGIRVVEGLAMDAPKTKDLVGTFGKLGLGDQKTLVVVPELSPNLYLSSRNLPKHRVMTAGDLSTYDIMNCRQIVFVDNAHEVITGLLTA